MVGLGAMGSGIAQLAVEGEFATIGREVEFARAEQARDRIAHFLTRKVECKLGRKTGEGFYTH